MDSTLEYYFDFLSQPSRALYILLKASGTKFEAKPINLLEDKSSNYFLDLFHCFNLNCLAKDQISNAFYPIDLHQRARVDEFLSWQHTGIRTSCSLYFRFQWVQEKAFGSPASEAKVAKYRKLMEKDLDLMENLWLKDTGYLAGNKLTAADVFGACEIEQIRCCGYEIKNKYPKIYSWIEKVRHELHPFFNEAHRMVYMYEKETKSKL
ncbi:glutathione S-transferase theta-3-like [Musca vetustissima]|uniref:glutathione S-transferase theta-3-like n=1 Tax=Musca vetustissima TaxID=27455 RepID=UPI002AB745C1|nr:glutathione S-transferase theta-3-like [Musca vetustissima]